MHAPNRLMVDVVPVLLSISCGSTTTWVTSVMFSTGTTSTMSGSDHACPESTLLTNLSDPTHAIRSILVLVSSLPFIYFVCIQATRKFRFQVKTKLEAFLFNN